jgi:hypothetical protein
MPGDSIARSSYLFLQSVSFVKRLFYAGSLLCFVPVSVLQLWFYFIFFWALCPARLILSKLHPITMAIMFDAQQSIHLIICRIAGWRNICALLYGHSDGLFLCSWSVPSVNLIFESADIWFCYVVLYARCSTVSSASADTLQRLQQQWLPW